MTKSYKACFFSFAALALSLTANGQTFLIDLNDVADSNGFPGGGSAWNSYADPANVNGSAISDTAGSSALGVTLSYSGTMQNSNNGNANTFDNSTGGPSWVTNDGSLSLTGAAADYFFTSTNLNTDFTVSFGNLPQGTTVNLDLWMSRVDSPGSVGFYEYSLDGGTTWNGLNVLEKDGSATAVSYWNGKTTQDVVFRAEVDGNDNARYMNINGLTIGAAGTLDVRVDDNASSNWAGLGAMRLTVVPEPATYALLFGLAVAGIAYRRRRS